MEKSISEIEKELSQAQTHMEDLKLEFQKIEEQAEVVVEKDNMCQVVIEGDDMNYRVRYFRGRVKNFNQS